MGIHGILDIDPVAWSAAYEETVTLLSTWRPRLLGWGDRTIEGLQMPMHMRSILCDADDPERNVELCRYAMAISRDAKLMREINGLGETAPKRVGDGGRG